MSDQNIAMARVIHGNRATRRETCMFNRRTIMTLVISTSLLATAGFALAKNAHHNNGHNLLGGKLHQNGKHEVGKIGNNSVVAEVSNDKVVGMSAGNLPVQKVKSNKKMAGSAVDTVQIAANGPVRFAQVDGYYAYCFDSGIDVSCYWYPATDVIVTDPWAPYPY
jgi:hypothetical protein